MNEVWNLDPIYKGFDDPAFAQDMQQCKERKFLILRFRG